MSTISVFTPINTRMSQETAEGYLTIVGEFCRKGIFVSLGLGGQNYGVAAVKHLHELATPSQLKR